eukprot:scaffold2547_cov84-Skeletonema_dohrnii-CCMP3373.AAC.1
MLVLFHEWSLRRFRWTVDYRETSWSLTTRKWFPCPTLLVVSLMASALDVWCYPPTVFGVHYPLPRKHDVGLMNILVERGVFAPAELIRINRVRHFKGILVLSELTHCDGITLRKEYLSEDRIQSVEEHHRYPIERPTASDFGLWRTALFTVFSTTSTLYRPLGKYLRHPPLSYEWLYSSSNDLLFRHSSAPSSSVAIYVKSPSASVSRRNAVQFTFSCTAVDPPVATHYAS